MPTGAVDVDVSVLTEMAKLEVDAEWPIEDIDMTEDIGMDELELVELVMVIVE